MNEEIMNYEEEVMVPETEEIEVGESKSGLSGMLFMAGGALLTAGGIWLGKQIKKGVKKYKDKKALHKPAEGEVVEPTEEQIMEATTAE